MPIIQILRGFLQGAGRLLPLQCQVCWQDSDRPIAICSYCWMNLNWLQDRCTRCGLLVRDVDEALFCRKCQLSPPYFDRYCGVLEYRDRPKRWLAALKFNGQLGYAALLGAIWQDFLKSEAQKGELSELLLIPVPLHKRRALLRGFNQVLELIKPSVRTYGLNVCTDLLLRSRYTQSQSSLETKADRSENVEKGVFAINPQAKILRSPCFELLSEKKIVLVDDVMTTARTVNTCAKLLKESGLGIEYLEVWTLFRA